MSVAFVTPAWPRDGSSNGVVTYTSNMRPALLAEGARVFVLAGRMLDREPMPDVYKLPPSGPAGKGWRRLMDLLMRRVSPRRHQRSVVGAKVAGVVHELCAGADLRLLQMEESFGYAGEVVRRVPVPVVVRLHGPWFLVGPAKGAQADRSFQWRVNQEGAAIQAAAGITCASRYTLDRVRAYYRLPLDHARIIPNAIGPVPESERWSGRECARRDILFVGRFDSCKGGDLAIRAFHLVWRRYPDARLIFVGPDHGIRDARGRPMDIRGYVREQIAEGAARERIEYKGRLGAAEVKQLRRRAGVTIAPSRFENFPNVVLEAMAQGCPVVATSVGGVPEIIRNERNGLLSPADDAGALASGILALLDKPEWAASLGRQAREDTGTHYHPEHIARQTLAFYGEVIRRFYCGKRRRRG